MDETKKPNLGIFFGIFGIFCGILLFVLQANGVEMNWQISIAAYVAIATVCIWSLLSHAIPHLGTLGRYLWAGGLFLVLALAGVWGTTKQYRREHSTSKNQAAQTEGHLTGQVATVRSAGSAEKQQALTTTPGLTSKHPQRSVTSHSPLQLQGINIVDYRVGGIPMARVSIMNSGQDSIVTYGWYSIKTVMEPIADYESRKAVEDRLWQSFSKEMPKGQEKRALQIPSKYPEQWEFVSDKPMTEENATVLENGTAVTYFLGASKDAQGHTLMEICFYLRAPMRENVINDCISHIGPPPNSEK